MLNFIFLLFSSEADGRDPSTSSSNWEQQPKSTKKRHKRIRSSKRMPSNKNTYPRNKSNSRDDSTSSSPFDSSRGTKYSSRMSRILDAARIRPSTHEEHTIFKKRLRDDGTRWTNELPIIRSVYSIRRTNQITSLLMFYERLATYIRV